jgi:hypothetical protein
MLDKSFFHIINARTAGPGAGLVQIPIARGTRQFLLDFSALVLG